MLTACFPRLLFNNKANSIKDNEFEYLFGIEGFGFAEIQQMHWGVKSVGLGNKVPIAAFCVPFGDLYTLGGGK